MRRFTPAPINVLPCTQAMVFGAVTRMRSRFQSISLHRSERASLGMRNPPYRARAINSRYSAAGDCSVERRPGDGVLDQLFDFVPDAFGVSLSDQTEPAAPRLAVAIVELNPAATVTFLNQ